MFIPVTDESGAYLILNTDYIVDMRSTVDGANGFSKGAQIRMARDASGGILGVTVDAQQANKIRDILLNPSQD